MLTYSSYTDFLFSSARPLLYTFAPRHHLFSSLLMQRHLFFFSVHSGPGQHPAAPTQLRAPAEGENYDGSPADASEDLQPQSTQQHPVSLTHSHTQIYTLSYTEHTVLHTYILPLPQLQCTTTKSLYSWWSCL